VGNGFVKKQRLKICLPNNRLSYAASSMQSAVASRRSHAEFSYLPSEKLGLSLSIVALLLHWAK
jgi:hypothetical protein